MVGCVTDGWHSVHIQLERTLQEYKSLMCALSTHIMAVFTACNKGDNSQYAFFTLTTAIQRFTSVSNSFLFKRKKIPLFNLRKVVNITNWNTKLLLYFKPHLNVFLSIFPKTKFQMNKHHWIALEYGMRNFYCFWSICEINFKKSRYLVCL